MVPKTLTCGVVLACGVLALASPAATADDNKGDKPALSGTWVKKDAELKIEFADKDVVKFFLHGDNADKLIAVVCEYTVEKDGLVQAKVTGHEGKEEIKKAVGEKLPVGVQFSFKWTAKGDAAKLEDLKGDKVPEIFKTHVEGDFEKK
jgi:hypothetical protein